MWKSLDKINLYFLSAVRCEWRWTHLVTWELWFAEFLTFSVLIIDCQPDRTTLHGVANPARGLLNRRKRIYWELESRWHYTSIKKYVCVFFPSILDIKFVGRTSRGHTGGRSHRIFNPPSFCGACLDFCREKDSAVPFPRRPWSRILCTNELIVLHPLGIFILVF